MSNAQFVVFFSFINKLTLIISSSRCVRLVVIGWFSAPIYLCLRCYFDLWRWHWCSSDPRFVCWYDSPNLRYRKTTDVRVRLIFFTIRYLCSSIRIYLHSSIGFFRYNILFGLVCYFFLFIYASVLDGCQNQKERFYLSLKVTCTCIGAVLDRTALINCYSYRHLWAIYFHTRFFTLCLHFSIYFNSFLYKFFLFLNLIVISNSRP